MHLDPSDADSTRAKTVNMVHVQLSEACLVRACQGMKEVLKVGSIFHDFGVYSPRCHGCIANTSRCELSGIFHQQSCDPTQSQFLQQGGDERFRKVSNHNKYSSTCTLVAYLLRQNVTDKRKRDLLESLAFFANRQEHSPTDTVRFAIAIEVLLIYCAVYRA